MNSEIRSTRCLMAGVGGGIRGAKTYKQVVEKGHSSEATVMRKESSVQSLHLMRKGQPWREFKD
jgi:hypothetical protein